MGILRLALKNATVKWWRSLTLGFFIFSVSLVMVLCSSFILAAKSRVENVITNGITGNIEIRSDKTMEGDMVAQYSQGWDALKPIDRATIDTVGKVLKDSFPEVGKNLLVRQSAFLANGQKREQTMLLGIEPGFDSYKSAFLLSKGRYLDPHGTDEIMLTEEQAASFKVDVGESITVTTKNMYGLNSSVDLKVVGIGNYIMLSLFSYNADYTNSSSVRKLVGMGDGEATDIILFTPQGTGNDNMIDGISQGLKQLGLKPTITKNDKVKSEDIMVKDFDVGKLEENDGGLMISGSDEMGNSFKGVSETMFTMLNILVIFLIIIVSILIVNLVYMAGIERYKEIGTLRAIGFSRSKVVTVFMGEVLFISLLASLAGIILGCGLVLALSSAGISSPIPAMDYIMGKTLTLEIDIKSIYTILAVITGFSFAAAFYPAFRACSIDPAESLRSV